MSTMTNIGDAGAGRDRDQNKRQAQSPPGESLLSLPASNPSLMAQASQVPVPLPPGLQHLTSFLQRGSNMAGIPSVAMAGVPSGVNFLNQVLQQGQQLEPSLTLQTLAELAGRVEQKSAPSQQHLTTGIASQDISQGITGGKDATKSKVLSSTPGGEASAASKPYLIPCRARGMPEDHDFRNAHFVIPPNIQHGEELICSYEKCRNLGVKFRYCTLCRLPVAKRNFNQRHAHGNPPVNSIESTWVADLHSPAVMEARMAAFGSANVAPPLAEATGKKSSAIDITKEHRKKRSKKHSSKKRKRISVSAPIDVRGNSSSDVEVTTTNNMMRVETLARSKKRRRQKQKKERKLCDKILTESDPSSKILLEPDPDTPYELQIKWAILLTNRPDAPLDSDEMAMWLMQVMSASDRAMNFRKQKKYHDPVGGITLKSSANLNISNQDLSASTVKESSGSGSDVISGSTSENVSSPQLSCREDEEEKDRKPPAALKMPPTAAAAAARASSTSSNDSKDGDVSMLSATFAEWKERKQNNSST